MEGSGAVPIQQAPSKMRRDPDLPSVAEDWGLRKIVVTSDQCVHEYGRKPAEAAVRATAAAVIRNPWVGLPADSDLRSPVRSIAPFLAKLLTDRLAAALGGAGNIEAFGKGALVGTDGEIEHGAALIHTPYFANLLREFMEGESVIYFADNRVLAGETLLIPMCHKISGNKRNHYQTVSARIADAPRPGELVIVAAASTGPRPHARLGDRTTDPIVTASELESFRP